MSSLKRKKKKTIYIKFIHTDSVTSGENGGGRTTGSLMPDHA